MQWSTVPSRGGQNLGCSLRREKSMSFKCVWPSGSVGGPVACMRSSAMGVVIGTQGLQTTIRCETAYIQHCVNIGGLVSGRFWISVYRSDI